MGKQLILGYYPSEAAADAAVAAVKDWDTGEDQIRIAHMGILALDDKGELKTHKMGRRTVGKGAGIGLALAALVPPIGVGAIVAGGVLGALLQKGVKVSEGQQAHVAAALQGGKAAVGIMADDEYTGAAIGEKLKGLGAETVETIQVTDDLDAAAARVDVASQAVSEHQDRARS